MNYDKHYARLRNRIPAHLRDEFMEHMEAHDFADLADGAWFATLETAAEQFLDKHKIRLDRNDAAHMFLYFQDKEAA